jgi:general stress protein 26
MTEPASPSPRSPRNDRAKIRALWSIPTKFWWDSPDDPNIRLIGLTPHTAEF